MAVEIKVPDMGESIIDATISNWIKHEDERVAAGDALVELETDKVSLEVSAPQAGVLQEIAHQAGETVKVGDVLAILSPEGASVRELPKDGSKTAKAALAPVELSPAPASEKLEKSSSQATPLAVRMAHELGVDLIQIRPTGAGGRITKDDVQEFVEKTAEPKPIAEPFQVTKPQAAAQALAKPAGAVPQGGLTQPVTAPQPREERVRMSRRRQTIARRMVEAQQTAAMLTTFNEIDMTAVMDLRKRRRESFKDRFGVDLGFMSFFVKASIGALKAFPYVNAEIQGEEIVLKHYYDIGVAIGAEEGLVVPVIRDADRLNFAGIEKAIREFVDKVKNNTLALEDLRGGTFTITNGGVYGSLMSTPILNPPQVGILGMHAIKERPIGLNGQVVLRPMMYVALSYDHRIVDGRVAVQFLVRIKELVEDPEALLFG
jgi:2-oxoglutarate dehydrogenase E2 component (dihydrolipoamide succinyltransferase)